MNIPRTYVSPFPELTQVFHWLTAYSGRMFQPEYMCANCVNGTMTACPHWMNIIGYTEAQYFAHLVYIGRTRAAAEADCETFRTVRSWQVVHMAPA
ncbi:hypothetical protein Q8F55_003243 [Vanrija albida]|uniref:Uncharacterized protein n=1 Tax=Vanrija albida TaxID=181172 RepID=A0ABR3QCJ4_9TREE